MSSSRCFVAKVTSAVSDDLHRDGPTLIDSMTSIPEHLASEGVMGSVRPGRRQQADIDFGWPLLEQVVELDAGRAIAVREHDVIAVEAAEGTAALIERAAGLCRAKGWTLLKTARADRDPTSDLPTIDVETIERLAEAGGRCVALGAGRVRLIDKAAVLTAADRAKIAVVGID